MRPGCGKSLLVLLLVCALLLGMSGVALADLLTLRPDGVTAAGSWNNVTAANLNDSADGSFADITGLTSTLTLSLENNALYNGATINSATIYVRASVLGGSGAAEEIDFGPTGTLSGAPVILSDDPSITDYSYSPAGPFVDSDIDNLEIDVATTAIAGGETARVFDVWVVVDYTPGASPNQLTSCADCHAYPTNDAATRNAGGSGGTVGSHAAHSAYACDTCHVAPGSETSVDFAHRNGDIQMAGSIQGGSYNGGAVIAQTNTPSLSNCANVACHNSSPTPNWGTNGTLNCDSCHGAPPATNAHTSHYTAKGWGASDLSGTYCGQCHPDNTASHSDVSDSSVIVNAGLTPSGASPAISCGNAPALGCHNGKATPNWNTSGITCTQCHSAGGADPGDPVSGLHDETPTVSAVIHDQSIVGGCEACHTTTPSSNHWDGTAAAAQANFDGAIGFNGVPNPPTCTAASCHSDGGNWQRKWHENSDLQTGAECAGCHGDWNNGWNTGTTHRTDADPQSTHGTGTNYQCKDCHALEAAAGYSFTIGTGDWGGGSNHGNGLITINQNGHTFGRDGGTLSGCAPCHAQYDGTDGASNQHSFTTTSWGLDLVNGDIINAGCDSCHGGAGQYWPNGAGYPDRSGRHDTHMSQLAAKLGISLPGSDAEQKQMCDYCHNDAGGAGGAGHSTDSGDSIADVGAFNHIGDAANDGAGTWASANQTCAVACHNTKATTAGTFGWRDAGVSTCTMCHTVGGAGANPNSGLHNMVPTVSGQQHDDSLTACTNCHSGMPAMAPASTHIDNSFTADGAANTDRGLFGAYTDGNPGSCLGGITGNAGCHDGAGEAGTWGRKWSDTVSGASDGSTECQGCHGGFSNDWTYSGAIAGNVDHERDWDAAQSAADGAEVMASHDGTDKCKVCHVFPDGPYNSSWGGANHGNNKIDMNSTMGYSSINFNCSTTCHSEAWGNADHNLEDSGWTVNNVAGPALACTGCHGGGSPSAGVSADSPHSTNTIFASKGVTYTCEGCHTGHEAGTVLIPENPAIGIDYPTAGHGDAIALGGVDAPGASEAEICWNCHDLHGVSEWGVNSGGTYDYGNVDTLNWATASWSSANFSYKDGQLDTPPGLNHTRASMHDTLRGPWPATSSDSVGDVGCSYCHDVHDTMGPTAKPYLRGSWNPNGYKEDGAPKSIADGGTNFTVVNNRYGDVPRGGPENTGTGGWQIDQNNNDPNSGVTGTYDQVDGLCRLCHDAAALTSTAPLHKNPIKYFSAFNDTSAVRDIFSPTKRGLPGGSQDSRTTRTFMAYQGVTQYANSNWMGGLRSNDYASTVDSLAAPRVGGNNDRYQYQATYFQWGTQGTGATQIAVNTAGVNADYHSFTCSKCHTPHASRLPKLMITNCLDTQLNTWDDQFTGDAKWAAGGWATDTSGSKQLARSTSAQNCHRRIDINSDGDGADTNEEPGWNNVTPW